MIKGRFGDTTGRPCVEGKVIIPQLSLSGNVSFIFDTGADQSLLMPLDAQRFGVDYDQLNDKETSLGIGGASENYIETALMVFADDNQLYIYSIKLGISTPSEEIMDIPSLLGRDIIDKWRVTYDKSQSEFTAEVVASDVRLDLKK